MRDSYGTYDGSKPEPPYECPECGDLQAKLQDAEEKLERANAYNASWIEDVEIQRDRLQAEVARLKAITSDKDIAEVLEERNYLRATHPKLRTRIAELEAQLRSQPDIELTKTAVRYEATEAALRWAWKDAHKAHTMAPYLHDLKRGEYITRGLAALLREGKCEKS